MRGAGGGYNLARTADKITIGDVVRALMRGDRLFSSHSEDDIPDVNAPGASWVVRDFEEQIESALAKQLDSVTLAELAARKASLDDSLSYAADI